MRTIIPARTLSLGVNALVLVTLLLQAHDRGLGTPGVAALLACFALPTIAGMGISGRLADTRDSRVLLTGGVAVQVAALVLLAWSPDFILTLGGVLLLEAGQTVSGPVWTTLLPRVVGPDEIGSAIAWQQGLGTIAAPIGAATSPCCSATTSTTRA